VNFPLGTRRAANSFISAGFIFS